MVDCLVVVVGSVVGSVVVVDSVVVVGSVVVVCCVVVVVASLVVSWVIVATRVSFEDTADRDAKLLLHGVL